ncbi:MAG TPA: hypothetical protein VFA63_03505 [Pseudonocardiaceae bacterium]|nr:hypothetical protein [Pseudonocardiaceae bacterium]
MPSSLQAIQTQRSSRVQSGRRWRRYDWDTTPGKLMVAQIVLVLVALLGGGVGAYAAAGQASTIQVIGGHLESLNADVITLYRSLADADATAAAGFLSGGVEPDEIRIRYTRDLVSATTNLARASTEAGGELVTTRRIADITAQLPVYTGLVERARANNRQGRPVGVSYLRHASDLMQDSILPEAAELQRRQAAQLDAAYQRARSVVVAVLAIGGMGLAGLTWLQVFLFHRTQRVLNIGLAVATAALIFAMAWWVIVGSTSASSLATARGHSRSLSDALGPAQIAALQARAVESLELVTRDAGPTEPDFDARMQILERDKGTGGALGAARQFTTDQQGKSLVQAAIDAAGGYAAAHREVRRLDDTGDYIKAVNAAINTRQPSAATAFDRLDSALTAAVAHERAAFQRDIGHAEGWLTGLPIGTGSLAFVTATGVAVGVQRRLEEYR